MTHGMTNLPTQKFFMIISKPARIQNSMEVSQSALQNK